MRDELDNDPWGLGYKVVSGKLNFRSSEEIPFFSETEVILAIKRIKIGKAPGTDCIPAEAFKVAVKIIPGISLDMFNACLVSEIFPKN